MRSRTTLAVLSFALLVSPAVARAQNIAAQATDSSSSAATPILAPQATEARVQGDQPDSTHNGIAGAPMTGLRVGVHHLSSTSKTMAAPQHAGLGQPVAMMVVGLAGLVAGAVIGGDPGTIIMIGGAVVGLIGLWEYLQ